MTVASMELGRFRSERKGKRDVDPVVVNAPRTVMREGPVVLETEKGELRSQWDLFHEYFKKSEFLLVGEFYGERAAGIIDPVVASRQGSTNERPTGDYWNPRQEFRETALMAANLSLLEQGKLSEEEVLRQYDGMYLAGAKIEDLYKTLGRKLGRIKYGEVERRDAIEKRAKITTVVESQDSTTTEEVRDAHRFVVDSRAQIVQQAAARSESRIEVKKGKKLKVALALGVFTFLASSCSSVNVDINTVTPEVPITVTTNPGQSPTEAQSPTETTAPTNTAVPTETATPTPEAGIDMEKFHNFPESYEYLLAHPDEFVQAPDPITDRAAFDKWFQEELIPALGPVGEREVNIYNKGGGGGLALWEEYFESRTRLQELPPVFWFENNGNLYVVPCITTATTGYEDVTKVTVCPVLFNSPALIHGTRAIEAMHEGRGIYYIHIYYDLDSYRSDLDWGDSIPLVESVGDYPIDENGVKFGFGCIEFFD